MDDYRQLMVLRKLREVTIPISGGLIISCWLPRYMTEEEVDRLIGAIKFMKPALCSDPTQEVIRELEDMLLYELSSK